MNILEMNRCKHVELLRADTDTGPVWHCARCFAKACMPVVDVVHFQQHFEIPMQSQPGWMTSQDMAFRLNFLQEEMREIETAYNSWKEFSDDDTVCLEHFFDGLIDLVYVAVGTAALMGLPFAEGWHRVQAANMAKERARSEADPRSKRGHGWDIVKPEGWQSPVLTDLVTPNE